MLTGTQPINALIDRREAALAPVIDPRFTRDLLLGRPAPVQMIVDDRSSDTALLIEGDAESILIDFSLAWSRAHGGRTVPSVLGFRARYNPELASRWFIVPGGVAVLTQVVALLVVGLSIAREREVGTFEQLLVTPLRPVDILLGKGPPGALIGLIEATATIAAAVWWFEVPFRGGILALYLGLFLSVTAVTGVGLAISALSLTQQQALLGAFLFMVPSILLSGFATPIANMWLWIRDLTLVNPLRYFLVVVRGVFLEGATTGSLLAQYLPMALINLATLAASAWLFRKRVSRGLQPPNEERREQWSKTGPP